MPVDCVLERRLLQLKEFIRGAIRGRTAIGLEGWRRFCASVKTGGYPVKAGGDFGGEARRRARRQ